MLLAILAERRGQNSAVSPLRDKGFEDTVFHHALDGAYRQAQHFGCLAGAEIGLIDVGVFHGGFFK